MALAAATGWSGMGAAAPLHCAGGRASERVSATTSDTGRAPSMADRVPPLARWVLGPSREARDHEGLVPDGAPGRVRGHFVPGVQLQRGAPRGGPRPAFRLVPACERGGGR